MLFAEYFLSVENPERSWLWALLAALVKQRDDLAYQQWYFSLSDITFDACMHGGVFQKPPNSKLHPRFLIFWESDATTLTPMPVGASAKLMELGNLIRQTKLYTPKYWCSAW